MMKKTEAIIIDWADIVETIIFANAVAVFIAWQILTII